MEDDNQVSVENTSKTPWVLIGGIAFAILVIIAVIFNQNANQRSLAEENITAEQSEFMEEEELLVDPDLMEEGTEDVEGVAVEPIVITMDAGSFYYNPKEIRVKKGDVVQIVMTAQDMMHDFNIDELDVSLPITNSGETSSISFVADTAGEFEYYCSVGQHREQGQKGTLIVEE